MRRSFSLALFLVALPVIVLGAACGSSEHDAAAPGVLKAAAAEATAIIEQAQATAIVLQARAQATAMVAQANTYSQPTSPAPTFEVELAPADQPRATPMPETEPQDELEPTPLQTVEVMGVGFAGEGGMILVRFMAPPDVAEKWWQGSVSVADEASGIVYNEIPVMPKIGPLIGRPKFEGQPGYVMLVNPPPYLQPGAVVTVKLGNYSFEHVPVQ
jgi:hypothetical protein